MKKFSISRISALLVVLLSFQGVNSQSLSSIKRPDPLTITMQINYSEWAQGNRYEAITFSDSDNVAESLRDSISKRRGRRFNSTVKRNQELIWNWEITKPGKNENLHIVLISVMRQPDTENDIILTQPWYNSEDGGETIKGETRRAFKGGAEEHYLISFAVSNGEGGFDTYTIDPLITGHM